MSSENNLEVNLESSRKEKSMATINEDDDVVEIDADEIQDTTTGTQAGASKGKRKRRLTSPVWQFFEKLAEKSIDGKSRSYVLLKEYSDGTDEDLRAMSLRMVTKFEKYWSEFSVILSIAVILDPSQSSEFQTVRDKLFSFYEEYTTRHKVDRSSASKEKVVPDHQESETVDMLEKFDDYADNVYSASSKKSELEKYLDETRSDRKTDLDILEYRKINSQRYPTVARMARDILSIPVSTVASEAAFSCGGRVLNQYRSSLKPDLVEALMCSRD
ncbi:zinc finger BED domain-containing protein RICESLEEPER 2-like [Punica granatum]|uniref:Zinc finger BED domain-containing protein RICESLEEPER 2-like n=1 Tax=Punica granatum TaxID=22663 RepID=A0A6P8BY95_PUNGR|nr:zinc finger BED domain-containing protein RICESLEEPER 2-like [Punica granatum]